MERLTHKADDGFEDWEETLFFVKSDPNGTYNILDIAKYQGEDEFDEILKNIAIRLSKIENILGDTYNLDRLQELVEADKDGRCVVLPCKIGDKIYAVVKYRNSGKTEVVEYFVNSFETDNKEAYVKAHRWRPTKTGFLSQKVPFWAKLSDFGKTVFKTRESAEAALAKEAYHE